MGLGNIFAYPRLKRIGGSLGTDGMINRSREMMAPLQAQRKYLNSKNWNWGFDGLEMMQMRSSPLTKTWASFERLEMTRNVTVIRKTQEKDFENECQEGITAQKLITQFWGCYREHKKKLFVAILSDWSIQEFILK